MEGREVFRHAIVKLAEAGEAAVGKAGLTLDAVDWVVPHQANIRIINATAAKLGVSPEKVVITVQDHGNTSAASIPLALSTASAAATFKPGDVVLMEGIGGCLAWGAAVLRL